MAPGDIPGIDKGDPLERADAPDGAVPPPGAGFELPGPSGVPLGPNDPPKPDEQQKKPKPQPQPTPTGMELTLIGNFPNPYSSAKDEKDAITPPSRGGKGTWFPSTDDFRVVGKSNIVVTDSFSFLLEIMKASKPITRLNFFSHAVSGEIATDGTMDATGGVFFGKKTDSNGVNISSWTEVFGSKRIMDPYARTWGSSGENSGTTTVTVGSKTFSLDDVRAKFAKDAVFWLFLCHGASNPGLHQEVANTFQVATKGLLVEIVYCAPNNFPTDRHHTMAPHGSEKKGDCPPGDVDDFHKLDANTGWVTMQPKKP